MELLLLYINPIKILVLLTLVHGLSGLNPKIRSNLYVLSILGVCFLTEVAYTLQWIIDGECQLLTTISIVIHHTLWILLLSNIFANIKWIRYSLIAFYTFAIVNVMCIEGYYHFNYWTFVVGAFIYLVAFILKSFQKLKKEQIDFFTSNNYLILCAPLLFFLALSVLFAFKSKAITSTAIFNNIQLFDFIIYFVNIVYYTLINIYIYGEKKMKHVK